MGLASSIGLGLALVRQIMQLHQASINYSYEKNVNVFRIVFPG